MSNKRKELIDTVKDLLKKSPVVQAMFEEFKIPIAELDNVDIDFAELDVSAKTRDKKIYLNNEFLENGDFAEELHYIVHELTHYLQQTLGEVKEFKDLDDLDYLEKPTEVEAFQYQIQFMKDQYGEERANGYVDDLLDFHDLTGKDSEEKRLKLLGE